MSDKGYIKKSVVLAMVEEWALDNGIRDICDYSPNDPAQFESMTKPEMSYIVTDLWCDLSDIEAIDIQE